MQAPQPQRRLSAADVALMIVGIMIGAGIFRVPADVAAAVSTEWQALALWALGGLAALTGALTYAELARRVRQAARFFEGHERVAICSPNT